MPDIFARLRLRAGTIAAWTSANPILAAGEPGYEVDTDTLRIGDGTTAFLSLPRIQTTDGFAAVFQPIADNLTGFSALTMAANKLPYGTGIGAFALTDLTAEARVFLAAASKAEQRTSLELADTAMLPIAGETNMSINPTRPPTRASVGAAILLVGGPAKRVTFTASGTFVKADHGSYPADHMVYIQAWAGGGGGGSNAGGGGGGYVERIVRYSDIPASSTITIGAGGATFAAGGNTSVSGVLVAYGGGPGQNGGTQAGGGGGELAVGAAGVGGLIGGGEPQLASGSVFNCDAKTIYGGGGGSYNRTLGGGLSFFGGGGGAGLTGAGGISLYSGGNGGAPFVAGTAPGGGGGRSAAGARGEVRITL